MKRNGWGFVRLIPGGLGLALLAFVSVFVRAAEVIPPAPPNHFNDYARVVRPETASTLNAELTQFERDTSNQIVVAIYPHMQTDSSIEDYTVRVKQAWKVGQKGRDNGAVLFIFSQDRTLYVQVGYGLEAVLTDALCKRIIEDEITPRFRAGDFDGGVSAGTRALMSAARGEYKGTGRTQAEGDLQNYAGGRPGLFIIFIVFVILASIGRFFRRNTVYSRRGIATPWFGGGGWGGGSSGGWGSGSGGGGSFSGGGGGGGGGGAGGKW